MKYNASELAEWLTDEMPKYGCFSFLEAKRMLYEKGLDEYQAMSCYNSCYKQWLFRKKSRWCNTYEKEC